ncbi:MAG TPA: tetratricopeptide repeat protein [Streptosporangiaceae bacterium]|nr:tetratricopeptide repeat protein [Streptosporangiaceae bacterium]
MKTAIDGIAGEEFNAFIGRVRELRELRGLLSATRALTLCGAAGIGKTRLAVRLFTEIVAEYPDGVWFVDLAELQQSDLVASRIASVVGVTEEPGRALSETLADALRPRRMLICLDNCEHLVDACARVCQRLLASSPGLRIVATSREPLRVAAETVWQVPPLSLPPPGATSDAELTCSDALRLFADRAAAAKPGFALMPGNVKPVAVICRALDGLPLAIELAAAWVRVLTVEQIAARLADRFRLLSSADRTAPARHRTLRAAIDWSHDLLEPGEKVLMRRLSVFADWPLDMAEQVCADDPRPAAAGQSSEVPVLRITARDVLDLLTGLADKSLVIAEPDAGGATRYRMLDTIREYAAARLREAGEDQLLQERLREYAVREVEEIAWVGMAQVPAPWSERVAGIRRFEAETANLRLILSRCLTDGDAEAGLRICASMRPVWIIQGSFAEGCRWMDALLALGTDGLPRPVLGSALVSRAQLSLATESATARELATVGLELCRVEGWEFWAGSALNLLAEVALHSGSLDEAAASADEALAVARGAGDRFNEGYALGTHATVAAYRGLLDRARELGETALAITREIDQQWGAARTLLGLGDLARISGDNGRARRCYQEALGILREVKARPEIARCLAGLGRIAISQGELAAAREFFRDSIELSKSIGSRVGVIRAVDAFALLAAVEGELDVAVRLAAAAESLRLHANLPAAPASRSKRILDAAAALGEQVISDLWAAGSALGSEEAVELALRVSAEQQSPPGHRTAAAGAARQVPAGAADARSAGGSTAPGPAGGGQPRLTAREIEVANLLAQGCSNKAIAGELFISPATAARHVANIMGKLGFSSRVQIATWALRRPPDELAAE